MRVKEFRGVTQTDFWKTRLKYELTKNWWMNFPEIGPAYALEIEILKNYWMSFPEIGRCHAPENWHSGKISGWVFQDFSIEQVNRQLSKMAHQKFSDLNSLLGEIFTGHGILNFGPFYSFRIQNIFLVYISAHFSTFISKMEFLRPREVARCYSRSNTT